MNLNSAKDFDVYKKSNTLTREIDKMLGSMIKNPNTFLMKSRCPTSVLRPLTRFPPHHPLTNPLTPVVHSSKYPPIQ